MNEFIRFDEIFLKLLDEEYARMPELFYLDDYDRCMLNKDKSQYCNFVYQLEPINSENSSEVWKIVHVSEIF